MTNNPQESNIDDIVSNILGNIPQTETASVRLPSLGKIYGLDSEFITIRGMTFQDEKALLSIKDKTQAINLLISRCVEEDLDPRKLIPQDKIFIVVNIRALSIGKAYDLNITCGSCASINKLSIDVLDVFKCDYPDEPISKLVEVDLPVIKKKAVVKRASSVEIEASMEKIYERLWAHIHSIDGREETAIKMAIVEKLPIQDVHEIIRNISCEDIGLNTKFIFECVDCGHEEVTDLSLSQDFFMMR